MHKLIGVLALTCAAAGAAIAQTAVEYTLGVGRAGAAAGVGKSAGGVFDRLGKTMDKATAASERQGTVVTVTTREAEVAATKKPRPVFEDPKGIQEGMEAPELTRRFGDPLFKMSGPDGSTKHFYEGSENEYTVFVKDSKVLRVTRAPKPQAAGVVVLK